MQTVDLAYLVVERDTNVTLDFFISGISAGEDIAVTFQTDLLAVTWSLC